MQEDKKDKSSMHTLFRGQSDRAYLFGKLEKLAHAVMTLTTRADNEHPIVERLEHAVLDTIAEASGGTVSGDQGLLVARLLELVSLLRLAGTVRLIHEQNTALLAEEYLGVLQKLSQPSVQGMVLRTEDLMSEHEENGEGIFLPQSIDTLFSMSSTKSSGNHHPKADAIAAPKTSNFKGQNRTSKAVALKDNTHSSRSQRIIMVVKSKGVVSIRDVASIITECSEKTIQRELLTLVESGVLKKQGERRWSTYRLA